MHREYPRTKLGERSNDFECDLRTESDRRNPAIIAITLPNPPEWCDRFSTDGDGSSRSETIPNLDGEEMKGGGKDEGKQNVNYFTN